MEDVRVEFEGVWKKFRRGDRPRSLRDALPRWFGRWARSTPADELGHGEFFSLADVSFRVRSGECLGVIGPNGAGKSTLLKCTSRILRPNRGQVRVRGRVSALIEVGAGFHPDLTGRENVFLNGTILGMRRREIAQRFDEIVAFSGMEKFIDTPVKRYSSGMYARLGFSVAAFMDPDVLLIDEVLSVGDASFARRCERKIKEIVAGDTAVLFVSHNLSAVRMICDRVLLLSNGSIAFDGPAEETIHAYHELMSRDGGNRSHPAIGGLRFEMRDEFGKEAFTVRTGEDFLLDAELTAAVAMRDVSLGFFLRDEEDHQLYAARMDELDNDPVELKAGQQLRCRFRLTANLMPGTYWVGSVVRGWAETESGVEPVLLDHTPNRIQLTVVGGRNGRGSANLFGHCKSSCHESVSNVGRAPVRESA